MSAETLFVFALIGVVATGLIAEEYDLAILNGRVLNPETKLDAIRNVGVKDGKIAVITEDAITGKENIDAKDHVVSPGFIDRHCPIVDSPLGLKVPRAVLRG